MDNLLSMNQGFRVNDFARTQFGIKIGSFAPKEKDSSTELSFLLSKRPILLLRRIALTENLRS